MNQIDYENLGTRMKELRIKMKLTQAEVARALNVTPGYISNVENNRTAMSLRILIYYARLLNISLDSLIGRIDSEYRETALDREISEQVHKLEIPQKQKLLKTMKVWTRIKFSAAIYYPLSVCPISRHLFSCAKRAAML